MKNVKIWINVLNVRVTNIKRNAIGQVVRRKYSTNSECVGCVEWVYTWDAGIFVQCYFSLFKNIVECRPTAAGIVFGVRTEQILAAHDAFVDAFVVDFIVFAGERTFSASLLRHLILHRGQSFSQFVFCFHFIFFTNDTWCMQQSATIQRRWCGYWFEIPAWTKQKEKRF